MASLKALSEDFHYYVDAVNKLAGRPDREAIELTAYAKGRVAAIQDEYTQARTTALAAVKRSASYQPGTTIVVLNGEHLVEDEHGTFTRIR